jgi:hypothetical protein
MTSRAYNRTHDHFTHGIYLQRWGKLSGSCGETRMARTQTLADIEARIGIARDNIRQLIEQAAATSGAETEALVSDRIAQQTEELERLTSERDALVKKSG